MPICFFTPKYGLTRLSNCLLRRKKIETILATRSRFQYNIAT
jgi:hypothetical protein